MKEKKKLIMIIFINIIIFVITNLIFTVKYEQVDDFIIYNLYSGLDGTYNIHGVYIHPLICCILGLLFRIIPVVNWHSIFLLSSQFICFTLIGYIIIKKHNNGISVIMYTIFASIFYSTLLMLIQYTSVGAILVLTSFMLLVDKLQQKENKSKKYNILIFTLFTIGIMTRMQCLLIILPFIIMYFIISLIQYVKKKIEKEQIIKLIKNYLILIVITILVYISNLIIYNTDDVYKEYIEYNNIRTTLHDIVYVDYNENKEIFDEVGWSKNDHYLFYTFNFGDENVYSKENLEKILNYKIQKDGKYNLDRTITDLKDSLTMEQKYLLPYVTLLFLAMFIVNLFHKKNRISSILIFITTIGVHLIFIILNRSMLRVLIPEYILGTVLLIYNLHLKSQEKINDSMKNCIIILITICIFSMISCKQYNYDYKLGDHKSVQDIISYTNENKQNVYLYTVPSLQFRYLAYNVYQMPPKGAFSNLRVIGGWDMYTKNYYDFKNRYDLEGTFLDLLKDNVYLIDGDVTWSGREYHNYKDNVLLFIKEHYGINTKCEEIKQFDNLKIYKVYVDN